jgi:RimJ/RimL family protein N-acetyltransferase
MAPLLNDAALHIFTGGRPLTLGGLRGRYERLARGGSADGAQRWLNWVVRLTETREPVGTVQATVTAADERRFIADLAWVIATPHQGRDYATEAASAIARWLRQQGADVLAANIHPRHEVSMRVARALGLAPTSKVVEGEVRWVRESP